MCKTIRVAILDHDYHKLYVEDIDRKYIEQYAGSLEDYIRGNYLLGNFSYEKINDATYLSPDMEDSVTVNFEDII